MNSLLVLGGARCVWNDVASLGVFNHDVAAVNDIGGRWEGPLVFWATLHPRKLARWEKGRKDRGYPDGYVRYSNKMGKPKIDKILDDWGGSSGLFAVKVALYLGYKNIILAGIPMEINQGHYFNNSEWAACDHYRRGWLKHLEEIKPHVTSCSGWTREILGPPIK